MQLWQLLNHVHPRRGSNAGNKNSQCEHPEIWTSSLVRSHALVQTQISGGTSGVDAKLISPKRTENVNELQVAVMQWELTLVEHESKFSEVVADSVKNSCNESHASQGCAREILRRTFPSRRTSKSCVCICGREAGWTRCERWRLDRSTNPKDTEIHASGLRWVAVSPNGLPENCNTTSCRAQPQVVVTFQQCCREKYDQTLFLRSSCAVYTGMLHSRASPVQRSIMYTASVPCLCGVKAVCRVYPRREEAVTVTRCTPRVCETESGN